MIPCRHLYAIFIPTRGASRKNVAYLKRGLPPAHADDSAASQQRLSQNTDLWALQRDVEPNADHGMTALPIAIKRFLVPCQLAVLIYVKIQLQSYHFHRNMQYMQPRIYNFLNKLAHNLLVCTCQICTFHGANIHFIAKITKQQQIFVFK